MASSLVTTSFVAGRRCFLPPFFAGAILPVHEVWGRESSVGSTTSGVAGNRWNGRPGCGCRILFSLAVFWFALFLTKVYCRSSLCFFVHNIPFFSSCFEAFLRVMGFKHLDYDVTWCSFIHVASAWCLLSFLCLWVYSFQQV